MKGTTLPSTVPSEGPKFFGGVAHDTVLPHLRLSSLTPDSGYVRTFEVKDSVEATANAGTEEAKGVGRTVGGGEIAPYQVKVINRVLRFGFGGFVGSVLAGLLLVASASPGQAIVAAAGLSLMWLGFAAALGSLLVLGFRLGRFLVPPLLLVIMLVSSIALAVLLFVSSTVS